MLRVDLAILFDPQPRVPTKPNLKDQMILKSWGAIPIYYESLYGISTLNPFRVHFVLKEQTASARILCAHTPQEP